MTITVIDEPSPRFDAIELNTVAFYRDERGARSCTTLSAGEEESLRAEYGEFETVFSVYGHLPQGGVDCLCDCATPEAARWLAEQLGTHLTVPVYDYLYVVGEHSTDERAAHG